MDCKDERARRLLPSFDGLRDAGDEEYLQNHLATCPSCTRRREKFRQLDVRLQALLTDVSMAHVDGEKLNRYLLEPGSLSRAEASEIKLHLELCRRCEETSELLSECNEEIASGLWDRRPALSKSEEATFQRIDRENWARLQGFFPAAGDSAVPRTGARDRELGWLRALVTRRKYVWAGLVLLVAAASIAIYLRNTGRRGHTRSTDSEIRLVSPGDDETLVRPYVFRWEPQSNVVKYELTIKDIERPEDWVIRVSGLSEAFYQLTDGEALKLDPGRVYQWEVTGLTGSQRKVSSPIRVFRMPAS